MSNIRADATIYKLVNYARYDTSNPVSQPQMLAL